MDSERLKELLLGVKEGRIDVGAALNLLRDLPYEDLGFAKLDLHRPLRVGSSEVVYCPGKSLEQIKEIIGRLASTASNVMATKATPQIYQGILEVVPNSVYHEPARIVVANPKEKALVGSLAVVCAGTSDIPIAEEAAVTAEVMGSAVTRIYDVGVAGIHRLLSHREELLKANVIIVVAGMEGALASVVGGLAGRPVIAVPTSVGYGASFQGVAALLSMLNSCVPWVSVVNIDNGFGAGCQADLINRMCENKAPTNGTYG